MLAAGALSRENQSGYRVGSSQSRDLRGGIGKAGAERERRRKAGPSESAEVDSTTFEGERSYWWAELWRGGEKAGSEWLPAVALVRLGLE